MSVSFTRANIADLAFSIYDRSVHPELFQVFASTEFGFEDYSAQLQICEAGHTVAFRHAGQTITEVVATREQLLPQFKRILERRIRDSRDETHRFENGIRYQASFQLERLDPEVFQNLHEELTLDCTRADLAVQFPPGHRLAPAALSLIRTDATASSLLVHAYHTFPESAAVVKVQSLFEL